MMHWRFTLPTAVALSAVLLPAPFRAQVPSAQIVSRIAEEADAFLQNAPKSLTRETLEQRATLPASRFRPRFGKSASETPKLRLQTRQIVSEYTVGPLVQSHAQTIVEFRQVVSVDGHAVQSVESARHALSLGMRSDDDRIRKRMLEDFARHGLVDIATDYGLILLAFTRRGMAGLEIASAGEARLGTDSALVLAWRQTSPDAGQLEFSGRQTVRSALQGKIWVRKRDGLPLRIDAWSEFPDAKRTVRDEAVVEYVMSPHGFLAPASVVHRHLVDGLLITENLYRYEPFKMFGANTEIKFNQLPGRAPAGRK